MIGASRFLFVSGLEMISMPLVRTACPPDVKTVRLNLPGFKPGKEFDSRMSEICPLFVVAITLVSQKLLIATLRLRSFTNKLAPKIVSVSDFIIKGVSVLVASLLEEGGVLLGRAFVIS